MAGTVETIAAAYLERAHGNAGEALREVIADALADLCEVERRTRQAERLISKGYVRGQIREAISPVLLSAADNRTSAEAAA